MIPGSVGAAPVQNIGAYGVQLSDHLHVIHAWAFQSGVLVKLPASECALSYRNSRFKADRSGRWLITAIVVHLVRPWSPILNYPEVREGAVSLAGDLDKIRPQHVSEVIGRGTVILPSLARAGPNKSTEARILRAESPET